MVRHNRLYHAATVEAAAPSSPSSLSRTPPQAPIFHDLPVLTPDTNYGAAVAHSVSPPGTSRNQIYDDLCTSNSGSNGLDVTAITPDTSLDATINYSWHANSNNADLSSFLDGFTLPRHQFSDYAHLEQPLPYFSGDPIIELPSGFSSDTQDQGSPEVVLQQTSHDSLTQFGSRLPSLQPEDHEQSNQSLPRRPPALTNISVESREAVIKKLMNFSDVIPTDFKLVSRHALSRYIVGFISGFHEHLPFLHIPTLSVETAAIELTLALAAIGAQYCREPEKGLQIFNVAKAICMERIIRRDKRRAVTALEPFDNANICNITVDTQKSPLQHYSGENGLDDGKTIETIQALLVLMAMATWFKWQPPAREAPAIRSLLQTLIRDEGLKTESIPDLTSWEEWVEYEGTKRTKLIVFCFFNLHSIVFDIPPMILSRKIDMELPCMEAEWKAQDPRAWLAARASRRPEQRFLNALSSLFADHSNEKTDGQRFSSLGSYILIHALIQHIWLSQELRRSQAVELPGDSGSLRPTDVASLEHALKSWQCNWEFNPESSVNPLSPYGPLSFNSTALLRLAYIRINIDTGPICSLASCNPTEIATSIWMSPPVQRSKRMTRAALHCAHALSIPIKLGINSIAHTRLFWSIQHAICSLECALLLTKWLESVTHPTLTPPRTEAEHKLLGFVIEMVAETEHSAPGEDLLLDNKRLSAVVVRIWATLFRTDDIWEMVNLIGRSLEIYANMLES